jgi:predicted phosphoribosyltransferase
MNSGESGDRFELLISSPVQPVQIDSSRSLFSPSATKFAIAQLESDKEKLLDEVQYISLQKEEIERDREEQRKEIERLSERIATFERVDSLAVIMKQTDGRQIVLTDAEEVLDRIQADLETCRKQLQKFKVAEQSLNVPIASAGTPEAKFKCYDYECPETHYCFCS